MLRNNSRASSFFPFVTATNGTSACGLVSMPAFERAVKSVILLSANLYTRTLHTMRQVLEHTRQYTRCNCFIVVNHFNYFHLCLAAAVFHVHQQQQPSKRLGCHGTAAAHQAFPFVTATKGASPCGFVSVRTCARRVNSAIHTAVVLKHKPVRGAPWANSGTCITK